VNKALQCTFAIAATLGLAGCVVAPPPQQQVQMQPPQQVQVQPPPQQDPHAAALRRAEQVERRIGHESHSIDAHVNQGYYPPPRGNALQQRLDGIHRQARDMESQFGGGLTGDEQRALNQELDDAHRIIGE
jgi:hypothetical protein